MSRRSGSQIIPRRKFLQQSVALAAAGTPVMAVGKDIFRAGDGTAALDAILGSSSPGDIAIRGAAGWSRLAKGADGQVLSLASGVPIWAAPQAATTPRYLGFYNCWDGTHSYELGVATGSSPLAFGRRGVVTPTASYAGTFKDSSAKSCPCPVLVGDKVYVYYEGGATGTSIFLEIYDAYGNLNEKPLEPVLPFSAQSGATAIRRPEVLYEPADVSAPFKMAYSFTVSPNTVSTLIGLATSVNGVDWTVLGQAIGLGATGAWDSTYLETTGRLLKDGSVYRLFYSGHNGTRWQSGEAYKTGTFGSSGWLKNSANPLLAPLGGYNVPITENIAAATKTVKVANSAMFDLGAPIAVFQSGSYQLNRVQARPDSTTLTTLYTWEGNYTTVGSAAVSQIHSHSVELCEVWYEELKWKAILTCFSFTAAGQYAETTAYAETPNLNTPFTIVPAVWPLPLNNRLVGLDQISIENLKFVKFPN